MPDIIVCTKDVLFHRGFYVKKVRVGLREVDRRLRTEVETSAEEISIDWTRDPGEAASLWSDDISYLCGLGYGNRHTLDHVLRGLPSQEAETAQYTFPPPTLELPGQEPD